MGSFLNITSCIGGEVSDKVLTCFDIKYSKIEILKLFLCCLRFNYF